jgi:hypothetical protein
MCIYTYLEHRLLLPDRGHWPVVPALVLWGPDDDDDDDDKNDDDDVK